MKEIEYLEQKGKFGEPVFCFNSLQPDENVILVSVTKETERVIEYQSTVSELFLLEEVTEFSSQEFFEEFRQVQNNEAICFPFDEEKFINQS